MQLKKRIENFSMTDFMNDLMLVYFFTIIFFTIIVLILIKRSRRSELDGEIFEILLTFEDFLEFKQLMLNYKSVIILFILKMIRLNFQKNC